MIDTSSFNFDQALNNFLALYKRIEKQDSISFGKNLNRLIPLRSSLDEFKNRFSQYEESEIEEYFQSLREQYITNRNFFNTDIADLDQALTELKKAAIAIKNKKTVVQSEMYSEDLQKSFDEFLQDINGIKDERAKPALNAIVTEMETLKKMTDEFLRANHSVDTIESESKTFFDEAKAIESRIQKNLQNIYPRSTAEKVGRTVIEFGGKCFGLVFGLICAVFGMVPGVVMGAIQGMAGGFGGAVTILAMGITPTGFVGAAVALFVPALIVLPIVGGSVGALYGLAVIGPKSGWRFGNECLNNCVESLLNGDTPWLKGVKERCEALIQHEKGLVDKEVKRINPG